MLLGQRIDGGGCAPVTDARRVSACQSLQPVDDQPTTCSTYSKVQVGRRFGERH